MKVQVDFYSETSEDIYGTMQAKIKYPIVSRNGYKLIEVWFPAKWSAFSTHDLLIH